MIKPDNRPFVWDSAEDALQSDAFRKITNTADEYNINVLTVGSAHFNSWVEGFGIPTTDFTVEQFNNWKDNVADRLLELQHQIEEEEFRKILK